MSSGGGHRKRAATYLLQGGTLVVLFALLWAATRASPVTRGGMGTIGAIGFLLLAGTLVSELVEGIGMPHLSGYLLAGILAGPHVFGLINHATVTALSPVNTLALALIALAGGAELELEVVKRGLRQLAWHTLVQTFLVLFVMTGVFVAARPLIPFARDLPLGALLGIGLLWGVVAISRSPSATLGILAQTRASGPLAIQNLTFVMSSDVVAVLMLAICITIARPLIEPSAVFSFAQIGELGHEMLGSVSIGTTLGIVIAVYLRFVGKQILLVLLALGFGASEVITYMRFDSILAFLVAGFVVRNLSAQGPKFLAGIEQMGNLVFVVFFATAGAHLDIPLLRAMWPVALLLAGSRALATFASARIASRLAGDPPAVRKWAWAGLVSQAGFALGIASVIEHMFPAFGLGFRALALATVALNEMIGPVLFKLALDRAGECSALEAERPSLEEEPAQSA